MGIYRTNEQPGFVREQAGGEATAKANEIGAASFLMGSVAAVVRIVTVVRIAK